MTKDCDEHGGAGTVAVPTVEELLNSLESSRWIAAALRSALDRDPVDAAADAELLAKVLAKRANDMLEASRESMSGG